MRYTFCQSCGNRVGTAFKESSYTSSEGSEVFRFAFPYREYLPAHMGVGILGPPVALDVGIQLFVPEGPICSRP